MRDKKKFQPWTGFEKNKRTYILYQRINGIENSMHIQKTSEKYELGFFDIYK